MTDTAAIDQIVVRLSAIAAQHGFAVHSEAHSGLSCSRYVRIGSLDGRGFSGHGKAARGRFCRNTGMSYPRDTSFNVRISDHHGFGGPTTVHASVRLDGDVDAGLARVDAALGLLAALPVKENA